MVVVTGHAGDQRRERFRKCMLVHRGIGHVHLGHPGQLGRCGRGLADVQADDQRMDLAELGGRGHRAARRLLDLAVLVVEQDERGHQITFASVLSFATSSATEPTLTPACRFGGSLTLMVLSRGAGSTPRSAGLMVSIGFLRAFMMFGSDA